MAKEPRYTGYFEHSPDNQRRVTLPAAWRQSPTPEEEAAGFTPKYYFLPGSDGVVPVFSAQMYDRHFAAPSETSLDVFNAKTLVAMMSRGSSCRDVQCDRQNRLALPPPAYEALGCPKPKEDKIVFAGSLIFFTLLSTSRWEQLNHDPKALVEVVAPILEKMKW